MHFVYWAIAGMLGFVCLAAVTFFVSLFAVLSGMRPELFSIFGPIFAIGCCTGIIVWMKGISVEKPNDMLRVRAVAVWLPVLLGLILTIISTITLWFGLWIAMTVAILNAYRNKWEREHLRAVRSRLGQ